MILRRAAAWIGIGWLCVAARAEGAEVRVAVAANFAGPMRRIATEFANDTGHRAVVSTGATGTFYAQIESGAPFEVLLAADEATPKRLESEGFAVEGTRFTYARGRLVLWSARPDGVDAAGAALKRGVFRHLAIANPKLAPYGAAAMQVLAALGLVETIRPKLVEGADVGQAYQFVATGNAEIGFVALSQVSVPGASPLGSFWVVPPDLYSAILQDAVLLRKGRDNDAARALCQYLKSAKARDVIRAHGYDLAPPPR